MPTVNEIDFIKVSAMKITPVTRRKTIGLAVAYLASPLTSFAAPSWPSKPVTIVSPYPAGGITDILCRIVADELSKVLGQSVVVDNRTGASGSIAHT